MNNKLKVYPTTKICLGYVTKLSKDNTKDFEDEVIIMKKVNKNGEETYEPYNKEDKYKYYMLNEIKTISTKSPFITENKIKRYMNGTIK